MSPTKDSFVSKFVLSFGLIVVSIAYAVWQNTIGSSSPVSETSRPAITPGQSYKEANDALLQTIAKLNTPASGTTPESASGTTTDATPTPAPILGKYANGAYIGNAVDAYYGTVQVKAIVQNGKLADVPFLQYPNERDTSRYINDQAMPLLAQEAIVAQSAQIDGISGATFTSQAFQESLASALALAKN